MSGLFGLDEADDDEEDDDEDEDDDDDELATEPVRFFA